MLEGIRPRASGCPAVSPMGLGTQIGVLWVADSDLI